LPWFRWFKRGRAGDAASEAPAAPAPESVTPTPAETAGGEQPKPRRRRGSRGGRGRRKSTATERPTPSSSKAEEARAEPAKRPAKSERRDGRRARRRVQPPRKPLPRAKRELLISVDVGEQRVAVLEDDKVAEVYLERPERRSIAGNIYKGRVENVLPGMEAAFIEIGLDKNGFLYVDEIVTPELEGRRRDRKITDLISRGEEVLVQAVKDPMKGKGARLTTEISLPGRFLVYVPSGEGLGVSRRLEDAERTRLRDILKALELPKGGIIVRTAAEGASAEDIEADLLFLTRLWKAIQARAKEIPAPNLVYQEAELPLRVVRDLFTEDFERALVDHERTYKRVVGYLKKTSPHMVERVQRYKEKAPLMEAFGVESEIQSTLSRRVDLPSGGYLIFDYAEAFTVIDVNTGRFTGSRSKNSTQRLEDTITKNNLEAVKEVVRQLRMRDIGGIIVIDFIDMANPKNRELVQDALQTELERDRTKTYVVEISPLGLVEMTRQNVTDGPREILTDKCPTCAGDGIVVSSETAALAIERRLRELASGARAQAFRVEINSEVADALIGPTGERLAAIEEQARRRFVLEPRDDVAPDHLNVLARGKRDALLPETPFAEGAEVEVKLVEIGRRDAGSGVGKLDGYEVAVARAANLVGKKVKVRLERFVGGVAYATLTQPKPKPPPPPPLSAEIQAEKPTRQRPRKRAATKDAAEPIAEAELVDVEAPAESEATPKTTAPKRRRKRKPAPARRDQAEEVAVAEPETAQEPEPDVEMEAVAQAEEEAAPDQERPRKRTRRGSRGGRGRKKRTTPAVVDGEVPSADGDEGAPEGPVPKIHIPEPDLGRAAEASANGEVEPAEAEAAAATGTTEKPKRKTRRGSRGGRRRRKPAVSSDAPSESKEP
jgi:ribonuclease G